MIKGMVFDVQRFSVHDGPGIRTTIFMKGCPLSCKWCHNPEGLSPKIQLQYFNEKCIGCKRCEVVCRNACHQFEGEHSIIRSSCALCGECVANCPAQALSICGIEVTSQELLEQVLKDKAFYGNDGGVTFSGGECLLQYEFIAQSLKLLKHNNLNTAIDTSGYAKWEHFQAVLPYCDLFLYDIKAFDRNIHKNATGVYNDMILENLFKLDKSGIPIWIRIPVIRGVNDVLNEMDKISDFIRTLKNVEQVTLMPYHMLGKSKYETLGFNYSLDVQENVENLEQIYNCFKEKGITLK